MKRFKNLEKTLGAALGRVLVTPYNWSLAVITLVFGILLCCFGFWNSNFDMVSTVTSYIMLAGVAATVAGLVVKGELFSNLARLGALTQIVTILAIVIAKSAVTSRFGILVIPLSIFCFLLLLKNIWLITLSRDEIKVTA